MFLLPSILTQQAIVSTMIATDPIISRSMPMLSVLTANSID